MEIAIGAIGISVVLMVGYIVMSQVREALPTVENVTNQSVFDGLASTQVTVFAGFGLMAVGVIVMAAFGLINIFK